MIACTPLGHVKRLLEDSYVGMKSGGERLKMDESPTSTIVSLTSAAVGPIKCILPLKPFSTRALIHSAAVRVFPQPLPVNISQICHPKFIGGICLGRAQYDQSYNNAINSLSVSRSSLAFFVSSGKVWKEFAKDNVSSV